jgi:hypothetical protein
MAMPGVGLRQEQIAQITGPRDPRVNLQALVQWRLVMVQGDRYQLATPLKGAIGVEFDAQPWLERALTYWLAWVGQADVEAVLMDLPGLIYILRWAVGQGRWAEVLQLARALDIPLTLGKQWDIWGRVLQWALQAAWHQQDPAAEAWVWHQLGTRALCQDDVTTAYDALSQALKLRQDLGDRLGTALTLHNRDGLMQAVVPLTDRSVIETLRERSKTVGRWSKPSGQQATTVRAASRSENQRSSARVGEQGKTALALALLSIVTFSMALGLGLGFQKWLHWGPAHSEVPSNSIAEP